MCQSSHPISAPKPNKFGQDGCPIGLHMGQRISHKQDIGCTRADNRLNLLLSKHDFTQMLAQIACFCQTTNHKGCSPIFSHMAETAWQGRSYMMQEDIIACPSEYGSRSITEGSKNALQPTLKLLHSYSWKFCVILRLPLSHPWGI